MKIAFKKSFLKELKKLRNRNLQDSIADCIFQVESAEDLSHIKNIRKPSGYEVYYQIRIGDYRIG